MGNDQIMQIISAMVPELEISQTPDQKFQWSYRCQSEGGFIDPVSAIAAFTRDTLELLEVEPDGA